MGDLGPVDTRFRTALQRLDQAGRLLKVHSHLDPYLEVTGLMHRYDGDLAMLFEHVGEYPIPVCANFLASLANVKAVFDLDLAGIRASMERGLAGSVKPRVVQDGPCQEVVVTRGIDLEEMFPVLFHAHGDAGKYITGGVIISKDPHTGIHNASIHRLLLLGATGRLSNWTGDVTCAPCTNKRRRRNGLLRSPWLSGATWPSPMLRLRWVPRFPWSRTSWI